MLLGGSVNSVMYAGACALHSVKPSEGMFWLLFLPISFLFLLWFLSQVSILRFFITTVILVISFIAIGLPLTTFLFRYIWDVRFQGAEIAGNNLPEMIFTFVHIGLSTLAWIITFILTALASHKKKKRMYAEQLENNNQ